MTRRSAPMWIATCLVAVACAGPSPATEGFGEFVPWEPPSETHRYPTAGATVPTSESLATSPEPGVPSPEPSAPSPEPVASSPEPVAPEPGLELIAHGVQPIQRTDDEVVLLSVVEVVNHGDEPAAIPPIALDGEVVTEDAQIECAPSEVAADTDRRLQPGERRMFWTRTTCPITDRPQVVRVTARAPQTSTAITPVGETIVSSGIDTSATAAAD